MRSLAVLFLALTSFACVAARHAHEVVEVTERGGAHGPRVLGVIAHPDDESAFAATLYKLTTHLDGACDVVVITNGEGGFKYATLAEREYGLELTDEAVGRAELPAIRRAEMLAGAGIVGVRRVHFLGELDHRFTTDEREVLGEGARVWDLERVRAELAALLATEAYDFVIGLAPSPDTHAHHKAATALAAEAVLARPEDVRPVMLVARVADEESAGELAFAPEERDTPIGPFRFDRLQRFGYQQKLDYRIVVNWEIAAHKSQGTMQLAMNRGRFEEFFLFGDRRLEAAQRAAVLFARLAEPQFEAKVYDESAGTNVDSGR
jgi:LmbE family N-acetylglucosaminyl deacetylase